MHPWEITPEQARQIQGELCGQVSLLDREGLEQIQRVAGVDNAYREIDGQQIAFAAVVVLSFPELEVIEQRVAQQPVSFPYIPGLLAFRELPAALAAFSQVSNSPGLILVDAQGVAHPRRFGSATHLGLLLNTPSIGCAKTRLIGSYQEPGPNFGDWSPLIDEESAEAIGAAVRTRPGHKPLFVSPGCFISLDSAVRLTLACCREGQFMPEPTRLAHKLAESYAGK